MMSTLMDALSVTSFVFVMMLVIEYVNVASRGAWQERLVRHRWGQYVLAALLGVLPGCLGPFLVVGMYSHGMLGVGALVTAMIATSGDEAFVMLALIPGPAVALSGLMVVVGIAAGIITDLVRGTDPEPCPGLELHEDELCCCLGHGNIRHQLHELSPTRGALLIALIVLGVGLFAGLFGPSHWNWMRVTLLFLASIALAIVATVPEHFLEEHLWQHVVRQHLPRIFFWTFAALLIVQLITARLELSALVESRPWSVLLVASLVGLIPESGPHLAFVGLYEEGTIPFAILIANSIVQDGHGMLPLLAHSRRLFLEVKLINFACGILVGALALLFRA